MTLNDKLVEILEIPIVKELKHKYRNSVELSGWIVQKPKYTNSEKYGVESCSLIFYQLGVTVDGQRFAKSFNAITYTKDLIAKFKELVKDKVCFITMYGVITRTKKNYNNNIHITNFEIPCYLDIDLEPPYERATNEEKKE